MKWLAVLLLIPVAQEASAQTAAADSACGAAAARDTARPMIRVEASVRAESLRLNAPSQARAMVLPCNTPGAVRVERENLPDPAQPGVTYRDVRLRVVITADPVIACRLTAALAGDSVPQRAAICPPPRP